jgi:ribonuclease HI
MLPAQNRFFTILISTSMHLIWKLSNERVFETFTPATDSEIHNRWVAMINSALERDQILTNRARFGSLAIKKKIGLNTWSSTLLNEDSLPDNWTKSKGVLVGIRPATRKNGVG